MLQLKFLEDYFATFVVRVFNERGPREIRAINVAINDAINEAINAAWKYEAKRVFRKHVSSFVSFPNA